MEKGIQNYSFQLKLDGDNEVSAETLCGVLSNLVLIAEKTKPDEAERIEYRVKATSPGSFVIDFNVLATVAQQLFVGNGEIINLACNSIQTVIELLKMKSFLKGEKPKKVEESNGCVAVTNNNGTVNNFYISGDYINNPAIDKGLIGIGNALHRGDVPGMTIRDDNCELLTIPKEEYPYIQQSIVDEDIKRLFENTVDVEFTAKKPDLQGKSKWDIILDGRCIQASIEDDDWIQKVQQGIVSVNSKQILKAKMKITQKADKYNIPIAGSEKYYILKVYSNDEPIEYSQVEINY